MNLRTSPPSEKRPGLKEPGGWFAAGRSFQRAIDLLSDGAFKLFAYVCLQADRHTGKLQVTHKQLAVALGKSKRAIGSYIEELQGQGMCMVLHGRNQYAPSWVQITDQYWPYRRLQEAAVPESSRYVSAIREAFLGSGCSTGRFKPADLRTAKALECRGVPLSAVLDAILVGSCRKYISWLNGGMPEMIGSLQYFEQLIAEVSEQPLAEDYRHYLRAQNQQLAENWSRRLLVQRQPINMEYPNMADAEVVQ